MGGSGNGKGVPEVKHITWQGVAVGVVLGIIFAPQISKLPLVKKLPTA